MASAAAAAAAAAAAGPDRVDVAGEAALVRRDLQREVRRGRRQLVLLPHRRVLPQPEAADADGDGDAVDDVRHAVEEVDRGAG